MLELDEEEGCYYPMRYDTVLHYADADHSTFCTYRLPDKVVPDPTGEVGRIRTSLSHQRLFRQDDSSNNSILTMEEYDNDNEEEGLNGDAAEDNTEEEVHAFYGRTKSEDWKCLKSGDRASA